MKKCVLFCFIFVKTVFAYQSYELLISEANNHFDYGRIDEALTAYKEAAEIRKNAADAYYMIGHIHFLNDYYKIAYDNFQKAKMYENSFLFEKTHIELYFNIAAVCRKLKYHNEEIQSIKKVYNLCKDSQGDFYLQSAGKACFILAIIYHSRQEMRKAVSYFLKAAEVYEVRPKSSYLYVTHFYASHQQKEINEIFPPDKKKSEHERDQYFTYYFYRFKNAQADEDDIYFSKTEKYQTILDELYNFEKNLESRKDSEKNQILEGEQK